MARTAGLAAPLTVVEVVAVLLSTSGSAGEELTVAVLVTVPGVFAVRRRGTGVFAVTMRVTVDFAPELSVPRLQVMGEVAVQVGPPGVTLKKVTPAGNV